MKIIPEQVVQKTSHDWFNNEYCTVSKTPRLIIHSVVNGFGVKIPPTIPKQFHKLIYDMIGNAVKILKLTGMKEGISDMMIHGMYGRCMWVEFKTLTGSQREAQIKMQKRVEELQGVYIMPRSLFDFKQKISLHIDWLLGK